MLLNNITFEEFGQFSGVVQYFLSDLDAAMFQKGKSFFTSAHCEEWDNEMQNQGRAQALFACLSQALSEEEMPSPEKWLSHF